MPATQSRPHSRSNQFEAVCAILDRYGRQPAKLIPILQAIQNEYRYLPEEVMNYVATGAGHSAGARLWRRDVLRLFCAGAKGQARHPPMRRHGLPR